MRFLKTIMVVSIAALMAFATGCSSETSKPFFQNNHVSEDPSGGGTNPFTGLPNLDNLTDFAGEVVAAIGELFNPGDFNLTQDAPEYRTFVDNIKTIVDNPGDIMGDADANQFRRQAAFDVLTQVIPGLADDYGTGHGAYGLFAALRDIVGYIIDQETLDDTSGNYIDELYTYLDKIDDAELDIKHDVYQMMYKSLDYIDDTYSSADMETIMSDLQDFLSDTTTQNFSGLLYTMQEGLGKLLMRADTYIEYDDPLDAHGEESTGLGNSVSGIDYLLAGLTSMISATNTYDGDEARAELYDMIRIVGEMIYALRGSGPTYYPVLKNLLANIEDYYTTGGASFSGEYNHPLAGSPAYYTNAELRNSLKEMWPSILKLFLRERDDAEDNSDYALVSQNGAGSQSALEMLARALNQLKISGIDYSQAGNELEPSLKKMVTYNAYGESRSTASYKVSLLDHTAVTIGVGYNYGFLTRTISPAAASGEPYTNQGASGNANSGATNTISYQHGDSTRGVLTINDTMYSWDSGGVHITNEYLLMTTLDVWTDAYNLSLAQRYQWDDGRGVHTGQGKYVWRSNASFTPAGGAAGQTGDDMYEYYMGYDFPAQCLLGPSAAGDMGIPNGGRPVHGNNDSLRPNSNSSTITAAGASFDRNDFRTYYPKVADGKGCLNTAAWQFNWISRSCWDGAGPYYSTSDGVLNTSLSPAPTWTGHSTFYVYYKPNGEVYAYVDKAGDPWVYFYPSKDSGNCRNRDGLTTSNDVADPDDANGQRFNRYRDTYKSDYYAVQMGHEHGGTTLCGNQVSYANGLAFCVPPMNPYGTSGGYYDSGRGKYYLASGSFNAQQFWSRERIWEGSNANVANADDANYPVLGNMARECTTHEEAIFRNYQWLLYEKKFMFIIPQCLFAAWEASALGFTSTAYLDSGAYVVLEANGLVGLANLKKNSTGNGYWNIRNTEGVGADPATNRNSPDYGNSYRPGDSRVLTFAHYFTSPAPGTTTNGEMTPSVLYGLFGTGHVLPDIIGGNLAPVQRLGFVDQPGYIGSIPVSATAAPAGRGFLTSDACYTGRNKVLNIFVALAGALSDGTYYEPASSGYNYNYASTKHKYPLLDFLEGIMIPLSKPLMRLYDDGGAVYDTRWVPRMMDESGSGVFDYFSPALSAPYNTWNSFRPLNTLYPLGKFLADQTTGTYNTGLIPTLADNNVYLVTKLLSMIQRMGDTSASGPYYDGAPGGGVLENVAKGLEQIVTALQIDRGETRLNGYSWLDTGRYDRKLNNSRYGWLFSDLNSRLTGTPAPISVDLEVALDELIGDDTRGISQFMDDHPIGAAWDNYDELFDAVGQMMGNPAGSYYIVGDESTPGTLLNIVNDMLVGVTMDSSDRQALRHTLGVLMARYDGGWVTNTELRDILRTYLPEVMSSLSGNYENLMIAFKSLVDVDYDGVWDEPDDYQINDYLIDLLIHGETAGEVIPEMYDLLQSGAMWDSAYYNVTYPNKATLKELVDICDELSLEIEDL